MHLGFKFRKQGGIAEKAGSEPLPVHCSSNNRFGKKLLHHGNTPAAPAESTAGRA
jgi:hypothetical protein